MDETTPQESSATRKWSRKGPPPPIPIIPPPLNRSSPEYLRNVIDGIENAPIYSAPSLPTPQSAPRPYRRAAPPLPIPTIPLPIDPAIAAKYRLAGFIPSTSIPLQSPFQHSQPRIRSEKCSPNEKMEEVLEAINRLYDSFGHFACEFLKDFPRQSDEDNRSNLHRRMVSRFLSGQTSQKPIHVVTLMYNHRYSNPSFRSQYRPERDLAFSGTHDPLNIRHCRPALSCWATQLVGNHLYNAVGRLTQNNPLNPDFHVRLAASANERSKKSHLITWDDLKNFGIERLAMMFQQREKCVWYITECISAPRKKGQVIIRKRRPHPTIQVASIASAILSRNKLANGHLALFMSLWLFACNSHIDVKRVLCRIGFSCSDSTARNALDSMTTASLEKLRSDVSSHTSRGEVGWCFVIDNVQQYTVVREHGIGRENVLKVETAATAIHLDDCPPGAFDLDNYLSRVVQNDRRTMTAESLYKDIAWEHLESTMALHWARVLCEFVPALRFLLPEITQQFRSAPRARHRMREGRKTEVQALGSNAEQEVTVQGMHRAILDFKTQCGFTAEGAEHSLTWFRGDGASHATINLCKLYLGPTSLQNWESLRDVISTPEIWHADATMIGTIASNHYGPSASLDPSSLSRNSHTANMKRPTDLRKPDYYPTTRAMTLMWEARVLDCCRIHFCFEKDLVCYFDDLAQKKQLPTLDALLKDVALLVARYSSLNAYEQAQSLAATLSSTDQLKIRRGSPWIPATSTDEHEDTPGAVAPLHESSDLSSNGDGSQEDKPEGHVEKEGFDGDRVLSNSISFLFEFGLWIELAYAVPDGDIGRVYEVLKTWIFIFGGSTNANYMKCLLETHCLFKYESSSALQEAIFNNWLTNVSGVEGRWKPGDLLQEHYNCFLEEQVLHSGGNFDDHFYRHTISPNVHNFLHLKQEVEGAYELRRRAKSHTSPHLKDEFKLLLQTFREEEVHLFRSGRSMHHRATNLFDNGYKRLREKKMEEFNKQGTAYAALLTDILAAKKHGTFNAVDTSIQIQTTDPTTSSSHSDSVLPVLPSYSPPISSSSISTSGSSRRSSHSVAGDSELIDCDDDDRALDASKEQLSSGSDMSAIIDDGDMMVNDWYGPDEVPETMEGDESGEEDEVQSNEYDSHDRVQFLCGRQREYSVGALFSVRTRARRGP